MKNVKNVKNVKNEKNEKNEKNGERWKDFGVVLVFMGGWLIINRMKGRV